MTDLRKTISRRAVTLALVATSMAPSARAQPTISPADKALVNRAVAYLESLTEATARFSQTDARGRASSGTLHLKRPGKARFAYDPPSGLLVVSDGGRVSMLDARLKTFDSYPLIATPLSLLLARSIRLDKGVAVTRVTRMSDGFSIAARDKGKQTAGAITLTFTDSPLALSGWTVTDAQGQPTHVQLLNLQRASGLNRSLFVLNDPRPKNVGRGKI